MCICTFFMILVDVEFSVYIFGFDSKNLIFTQYTRLLCLGIFIQKQFKLTITGIS